MDNSSEAKSPNKFSSKLNRAPSAHEHGDITLFSFFEELSEPIKKVCETAWEKRGKLVFDIRSYTMLCFSMIVSMPGRGLKVANNPKLHALIAEEEDPEAFAAVVCGLGGAICFGSIGAVVGATFCGAMGVVVGAVPALFTFGLSLPIGAVMGGVAGVGLGTAVGGSAGFAGAGTVGCTLAYFRGEIRYGIVMVAAKVYDVYDFFVVTPASAVRSTTRAIGNRVSNSADFTKEKAAAMGGVLKECAADRRVQVTATTAGVGAVTLGTAGAAGGAICGGVGGALVGIIPALFTFGLSIPIGAVVGGGTGLFLGGAAGTSIGFAGGGAVGFTGYTVRSGGAAGTVHSAAQGLWKAAMYGKAAVGFGAYPQTDPKEVNIEILKESARLKQQ